MVRITALIVACVGLLVSGCGTGDVEATIYGDGNVSCPDHWAQDESLPVGTATFRPTDDGLEVEVDLTDAAPDWTYTVEVLDESFCVTEERLASVAGELTTDDTGAGALVVPVPDLATGTYQLTVNVVSHGSEPDDPRLNEMALSGLTEVVVP